MEIEGIVRSLHSPLKDSHKGQNGKLLIVGGSRQYHGAPMFSILAARRFVDLLYFYPGENDQGLINAIRTIPEAMVVSDLKRTKECDCTLFGIGLADARFDVDFVMKNAGKMVIDGDGLALAKEKLCDLKPGTAMLTPHEHEFRALFNCEGSKENVEKMADSYGVIIIKKGPEGDIITNGKETMINKTHNPGMTKGGTGDVLAGLAAALACSNGMLEAAAAAAYINGYAGNMLMKEYGYNFCASDLAAILAHALAQIRKR